MKRFIARKVRLGRFGLPAWTIALAVLVVAAVAGQAVGPVLSGQVTGSVGMVVSQAVTLDTQSGLPLGSNPVVGATTANGTPVDDAVTTRNDEGTEFTVAIELNVGEREYVCVALANGSGNSASALLELNVPKGVDVEVEEFSESTDMTTNCDDNLSGLGTATKVDEGQLSRNTWLLIVGGTAGATATKYDGIQVAIEPKDGIAPGFYTITGRIVQIEG